MHGGIVLHISERYSARGLSSLAEHQSVLAASTIGAIVVTRCGERRKRRIGLHCSRSVCFPINCFSPKIRSGNRIS
jgi:hypothetical protein